LKKYISSSNPNEAFEKFLHILSDENLKELFQNNRFQYMIRKSIDDPRILAILCQKEILFEFLPSDIMKRIDIERNNRFDIALPTVISTFEEFYELLKLIIRNKQIPNNFRKLISHSIENNEDLLLKLQQMKILNIFKYNFEDKVFDAPLELSAIIKSIEVINEIKDNMSKRFKHTHMKQEIAFNREIPSEFEVKAFENDDCIKINIDDQYRKIFGDQITLLKLARFNYLALLIDRPIINDDEQSQIFVKVFPYIVQKWKMWGCHALSAENISGLFPAQRSSNFSIKIKPKSLNKPSFRKDPTLAAMQKNVILGKNNKLPFSRIDTIVGIMNTVDSIVAQDMLGILAKFPMALPLVIRDLHDNTFKV
jgi:hypothetical protein